MVMVINMDQEKQVITFEDIFKSEKKPEKKIPPHNKRGYTYTLLYYAMVMYVVASILVLALVQLPNMTKDWSEQELLINVVANNANSLAVIPPDLWEEYAQTSYATVLTHVGIYEGYVVITSRYNEQYRDTLFSEDEYGFIVFDALKFEEVIKLDPTLTTWKDGSRITLYKGETLPEPPLFMADALELSGPQRLLSPDASSILNFLIYLIMIPGIIYFMKSDIVFDYNEAKEKKKDLIIPIVLGYAYVWIGNIVSNVLSTYLASYFSLDIGESVNQRAIIQAVTSSTGILMIISAVFIGPIIEELVFRKALFGLIKNDKLALLASTIIFGLIHVVGETSIQEALVNGIAYFVMGFVFGYIYLKSERNIVVPTLVHILNNGISILFILILL